MLAVPTLQLAQIPERSPDFGRKQLGLFPGGEVAAPVDLMVVGQVGVRLLDPAARGLTFPRPSVRSLVVPEHRDDQ
jgi:hypothetical protein